MSQELQPVTQQTPVVTATLEESVANDLPASWNAAWRLTKRIVNTPFVPKAIRGDAGSVLACMITGDELGLGPMQSLRMVNVIEGRPAASAELMRALVNRAGHRIDVVEANPQRVTLAGRRKDTGAQAKVTWTMDDAQRAKLTSNPAWGKYPRSMLLARATSELCRMLFADVIGGLYTPEETAAIEGHAYELDASEQHETLLVDPVTNTDFGGELDDDDAADAAWVAAAKAEADGVDTATGELRHTPGA